MREQFLQWLKNLPHSPIYTVVKFRAGKGDNRKQVFKGEVIDADGFWDQFDPVNDADALEIPCDAQYVRLSYTIYRLNANGRERIARNADQRMIVDHLRDAVLRSSMLDKGEFTVTLEDM